MAIFTLGVRTPAAAASAAYLQLKTAAGQQALVREIGVSTTAATLSSIGLIRSNATGTSSTTTLGQNRDPGGAAAISTVDTAWSSAPTVAGSPIYLRRYTLPASIGAALIWVWNYGEGLLVPASAGLLLWNFGGSSASACDAYIVWEE